MNGTTTKSKVLLFVYGTLMTGNVNHHYLSDAKFMMKCELEDFGMFELGGYPGIKLLDGRCVKGELYAVNKQILAQIDCLEDEGYLYKRVLVTVANLEGKEFEALTYVYLPEIINEQEIMYQEQPYRNKYGCHV